LQYIIDQKIEVVSLSWGGGGLTQSLVDIFKSLRDAGVIVFSSSGNNGISNDPPNTPEVPKLFEGVIGIGAITEAKRVASYSNYGGKSVQFLAPGDQMLSTSKDGSYVILSGTSMACPTAVSSFSFVYGILKARCRIEKCPKSIVELQNLGLELMCQGSDPTGAVAGKSVCGIISTEASTKLALAVSLTQ
jgi:subtilisin family serine protease